MFGLQALMGVEDPAVGMRMGSLLSDRVAGNGEVFRLVTYMFLHVHWIHLLLNMIALIQLGALVEALYGGRRMFVFFVLTGIFAGITSAWFEGAAAMQMMGASGGIMGLAGVILGLCFYGAEPYRSRLFESLGRSLIFGISLTFSAGIMLQIYVAPLVGNWAHFGGMILGMAVAAVYRRPSPVPSPSDIAMSYGSLGVVAGAALTALVFGARGATDIEGRAVQVFEARLDMYDDGFPRAMALVGAISAYEDAGVADGVERFERAAYRSSSDTLAIAVALAYAEEGRGDQLIVLGRAWVHRDPTSAEALNTTAWLLVSDPVEANRDPFEALEMINTALDMLDADPEGSLGEEPEFEVIDALNRSLNRLLGYGGVNVEERRAAYLDTRAEALRQLGFIDLALEDQRRAVELGESTESQSLPEMKARLATLEEVAG